MKILVTGHAGFIGSALTLRLLDRSDEVVGVDNLNNYYDPALKRDRLERHSGYINYTDLRIDITDRIAIKNVFTTYQPQRVVNLAAQVGVRYSHLNPISYIDTNITGFHNILQGCIRCNVDHLVYASSSSVYGGNTQMPFSEHHKVDHPVSVYAATKKANELLAHTYSHNYRLPVTGLRLFTVYGPWNRPDMALVTFY